MKTVLLVEADSLVAWEAKLRLEAAGHRVVHARNAARALEMLGEAIDRFDLAITGAEEREALRRGGAEIQLALDRSATSIELKDIGGELVARRSGRPDPAPTPRPDRAPRRTRRVPLFDHRFLPFGIAVLTEEPATTGPSRGGPLRSAAARAELSATA